ncbi:MAG TPA: sigma-70 family RNA polymerase sigma factor [Deltaproteobacteria bacterium]|nr:sigma-70 family RNA polymerase sigma factor [Deltaproteobacteria bacterium]
MMHTSGNRELQQYLKEIGQYRTLSHEQVCGLARRYREGDAVAGDQIIQANLRFVVRISRRYFFSGLNPLEIIQEGNLGLIKALRRFDPERGVPFIHYASWWIKATILDYLSKSSKPRTGSLGYAKGLFSLDEKVSHDDMDKDSWVDFLTNGTDPEMDYHDKEQSSRTAAALMESLAGLSQREMTIIHHRCLCDPPKTLCEIGLMLGVSKERVRQIETRTKEKLRDAMSGGSEPFMGSDVSDHPTSLGTGHSFMRLNGMCQN